MPRDMAPQDHSLVKDGQKICWRFRSIILYTNIQLITEHGHDVLGMPWEDRAGSDMGTSGAPGLIRAHDRVRPRLS